MEAYGIIPARYKSSRFEGKPLALINGKPMFWHVYTRAKKANLKEVYLATDDIRIEEEAKKYDIPCIMTSNKHNSGSDRVCELAEILKLSNNAILVNIQGDEPLLEPMMINQLLSPFESNSSVCVTTLANKLSKTTDSERFNSPNSVKIVLDNSMRALYFSRAPIPYAREELLIGTDTDCFYAHIGLYAFRYDTLKKFTSLPMSRLENVEKLEQLRLLENGIDIHVMITEFSSIGVDTKEDLEKVCKILDNKNVEE